MDAIQTEEYKGKTIEIFQDENPEDPREWDNLGKMVCFHRRYTLGDKTDYHTDDYESWKELMEAICRAEPVALISPLFLYDHSGISLKIGSFQGLLPQGHAEFDSGQVGFIYTTNEVVRKWYDVKRINKKTLQQVEEALTKEVETYNQYLSGDVCGFVAGEDSCWGFYSTEEALQDARGSIDCEIKSKTKKHCFQVKRWIQNKVPLVYRIAMA